MPASPRAPCDAPDTMRVHAMRSGPQRAPRTIHVSRVVAASAEYPRGSRGVAATRPRTIHVSPTHAQASAYRGENLLRLAQRHDVPLEGACEGVTACSTCHVILEDAFFERLEDDGDEAGEAEEDMLDQAFGLEPTSRLACQLVVDDRFDGIHITLPEATRNFYVDGHVPQPH